MTFFLEFLFLLRNLQGSGIANLSPIYMFPGNGSVPPSWLFYAKEENIGIVEHSIHQGRVWLISLSGLAQREKTSQAEQGLDKQKQGQKRR